MGCAFSDAYLEESDNFGSFFLNKKTRKIIPVKYKVLRKLKKGEDDEIRTRLRQDMKW